MSDFYTLDEFMKLRRESFIPADQFVQNRMPFLSMDEFMAGRMGVDVQRYQDMMRYRRDDDAYRGILPILEQFGRGALNEATFGIAGKLVGDSAPQGTAEKVARGIGQFAGFLVPYGAAAKGVKFIGKAAGLTSKGLSASKIMRSLGLAKKAEAGYELTKTGAMLGKVGQSMATLGTASAIADLPSAISNPAEAAQRAKEGALLGAIFGGAHFAHLPEHKVLSWVLRQTGGRAAMAAVGLYDPKEIGEDGLALKVFHEAMNTFFLSHGITPEMILTGKYRTPDQKTLVDMVDADTVDFNVRKWEVPIKEFQKIKSEEVLVSDILPGIENIKDIPQNQVKAFKGMLRQGLGKKAHPYLEVEWDAKRRKYVGRDLDSSFIMALREFLIEAPMEKIKPETTWNVKVTYPEGRKKTLLPRPLELAMKFWGAKKVDTKFLEMLNTTRYWAYDYATRKLRPVGMLKPQQIGSRDILMQRSDYHPAKARWQFIPIEKGSRVPSFEWDSKKVFSKHLDDAFYRGLMKEIDGYEKKYPGLQKGDETNVPRNELVRYHNARTNLYNMYKRNVMIEEARADSISREIDRERAQGKKLRKWQSIDKAVEDAERMLQVLYRIPKQPLPFSWLKDINDRVEHLKVGIDLNTLKRSFGKSEREPWRVEDIHTLEDRITSMEKLPVEDRIAFLFEPIRSRYELTPTTLTGKLALKQRAVEALERQRRKLAIAKALLQTRQDPKAGSIMKQLLTVSRIQTWRDLNKFTNYIQNKTGIPLFDITRKLYHQEGFKRTELGERTKFLEKYQELTPEEQANVFLYYRRLYAMKDVTDIQLTAKQQEYISDINATMKELAPLIIEERHNLWRETVAEKEAEISGKGAEEPAVKAFPRQNEAPVREFLWKGYEAWKEWKRKQDKTPYDAWVQEAIARQIGTIGEGVYLPEFVVMMDKHNLRYEYDASNIGFTGKGHFKSREVIKERLTKADLVESLADEFRDKNLHVRIHAYVNQVMNVKYIDPYLQALEDVVNVFPEAFKNAKPPGYGRRGAEAKTLSMLDYLRIYAHRIKGYPVKVGPIGEGLRFIQSLFFRSLVVRPFLVMRNIPQRIVTAPHKSNVLDLRYAFGSKYKFDNMPEDVKRQFHSVVSQLRIFKQDYLQLMQTEKIKNWPIIGPFVGLAERVGRMYSLSDEWNRRYVFSRSFFRAKDMILDYFGGKMDLDTLDRKLGVGKMESNNQRMFREFLQKKDVDRAAAHLAEWTDINTNWFYKRTEKSLPEMTGEGESFTNLLTWSKSVTQWTVESVVNAKDGMEMMLKFKRGSPEWKAGWQKVIDGSGKVVGLLMCGGIANAILNTVSFQKASRFKSYGTDMFMWELGGVSLDIVNQFSEAIGNVVTSVDGTPGEKKRAIGNVMKMLDNTAIRQLIPFSKNALAALESFTGRSYISPLYDKWNKLIYGYPKGKTYVQRTLLEGVAHAIFATDPNKSAEVRRFVNQKYHELNIKRLEKGPMQPYYQTMYKIYEYYNDMLLRYEPYELFEDRVMKERHKMYEKFEQDKEYDDWLYKSDRNKYLWERR